MATVNGTRKEPDYTAERLVMIRAQSRRRGDYLISLHFFPESICFVKHAAACE